MIRILVRGSFLAQAACLLISIGFLCASEAVAQGQAQHGCPENVKHKLLGYPKCFGNPDCFAELGLDEDEIVRRITWAQKVIAAYPDCSRYLPSLSAGLNSASQDHTWRYLRSDAHAGDWSTRLRGWWRCYSSEPSLVGHSSLSTPLGKY
jgi:hypothetical protein